MAKNIVILSDGTCNDMVNADLSNVLKLYRILEKNESQVVFYDPGMGTFGNQDLWARGKQKAKYAFYSLTGAGLDECVLKAYRFLIDTYQPGDNIYMFGYSRGAYTVRVLAGLLYLIGILKPEQKHLCEHALGAYKHVSAEDSFEHAKRFKDVISSKETPVRFIGVWDTVSSVLIPHPKRLLGIKEQKLPYTATNPGVEIFRQAIAIDEKRYMFRVNFWNESQKYNLNRFDNGKDDKDQDIKQIWFAGYHGDVGGGFPELESGIAKFPLKWMVDEARNAGLRINTAMFNHLVLGKERANSTRSYVAPDAAAKIHDSLDLLWRLVNKLVGYKSRLIPEGAYIHSSVIERMTSTPEYRPANLPDKDGIKEKYKITDG